MAMNADTLSGGWWPGTDGAGVGGRCVYLGAGGALARGPASRDRHLLLLLLLMLSTQGFTTPTNESGVRGDDTAPLSLIYKYVAPSVEQPIDLHREI
jgi:hypothetical protein